MSFDCTPCQTAICTLGHVFPFVNAGLLAVLITLVIQLARHAGRARTDHQERHGPR